MQIIGLDLSLTSTGVAVVNHSTTFGTTAHVDSIQSKGKATATLTDRSTRLRTLVGKITDHARNADLIVIEGPSYGQTRQGGQHDRAGLWWLTVARLTGLDLPVVEVAPATRAKYATGKGNAGKDAVLAAVVRRYPDVDVTGNDEADALVLAAMGARWAGHPIDDPLPALQLAAMAKPQWPDHNEVPF